jgi:uncharacterized protein with HEPN domain
MQRDARSWLWDMRDAGRAIRTFVAGLDASAYAASDVVRSAVERKFEIIGEALNQLAKTDPCLAARIPHARQIVGFRNVLIHGYATVDNATVWGTIQGSLPELLGEVDALLAELGPAPQ